MAEGVAKIAAERVVVVMPNWLGDGVMATPFLRALRGLYPGAKIAAVARPLVAPVVSGLPFVDEVFVEKKGEERGGDATQGFLREGRFELGVLLPNSFRSAWGLWRGGVKRRLGYARDWRSALLTDRVRPQLRTVLQRQADEAKAAAIWRISSEDPVMPAKVRVGSKFQPVPTIDYYLELARELGLEGRADRRMELGVTEIERAEAMVVLGTVGSRHITMVPGANFGSSKCWPAEYFAEVADALIAQQDTVVLLASSPAEMPIVEAILAASKRRERVVALAKLNEGRGVSLGGLKEIVRRSSLMVCNDTGPRHFAAAFGVPVVTLFGPTDPVWAETFVENERQVRIEPPPPCGPCQLKKCPIDHRCMTGLTPERVLLKVGEVVSLDRAAARRL